MSTFKEKTLKQENSKSNRVTVDTKHNELLKNFNIKKNKINQIKNTFERNNITINNLKKKKRIDLHDDEIEKLFKLEEDNILLKKQILNIENNTEENTYFLETGHLMFQYYDKFKMPYNNKSSTKTTKKISRSKGKKTVNNESVLFFLNTSLGKEKTQDNDNKNIELTKSDVINKYLNKIDKNFIYPFENNNSLDYCYKCNIEKTIIASEGILVCRKCGEQISIIIDSDKPSYKDPPREISYFAYKRINHFNEWLAQFQAKESTEIPQEVFDKILIEINKERIVNMANLTPNKLREILKKIKLNKYYEHVPHIINRINGLPAPVMTRETEEKLRMMFKEIQTPFIKYCPKDRKNFLSYAYVLHKFVQLLELDNFLVCFPLLKSREKLHQQDIIWKKICNELQWEFIKSL